MRATICDFCGHFTPESDKAAMIYEVAIMEAEDMDATTKQEKSLLFEAGHVCMACTVDVRAALLALKKKLRTQAGAR